MRGLKERLPARTRRLIDSNTATDGDQEIAFALNPTAATLFRVTYYAVMSVAAVWIGRARRTAVLRNIGLALAVLAAGTALYGARKLDAIAARIGADLVAAVFLLAIAYWYRKPGSTRQSAVT